jgi:hypothetical protein
MDIITKTGEIWSENVIGAVISLIKVSFQSKFHSAMLLGIYSGKLSTLEFTIKILLIKKLITGSFVNHNIKNKHLTLEGRLTIQNMLGKGQTFR